MCPIPSTVSPLTTVVVETTLGAQYTFADMRRDVLEELVLPEFDRGGQLVMSNISQVVMIVPYRIVATIAWDGEVKWRCPA